MLSDVIKELIEIHYNEGDMELVLELIKHSLNEGMIDKNSVSNLLNEMAIESDGTIE